MTVFDFERLFDVVKESPAAEKTSKVSPAITVMIGLASTAWSNGALVLIAQILQAPAKVQQSTGLRQADLCTVLLLMFYRYTTSIRWRCSLFASVFLQKWQNLSAPLYCQVIIWSVRAMFRRVFGVSVLPGMEMLGSDEAEDTSKLQMQQYLRSE